MIRQVDNRRRGAQWPLPGLLEKGLVGASAAVVFVAPLPFGSVTPLSQTLLWGTGFVFLPIALWVRSFRPPPAVLWAAAALVSMAAFGALQACRWPASWAATLSPGHWSLWQPMVEEGASQELSASLSLAPSVTRRVALGWLAAAATLLYFSWLGARRANRRVVAGALVASALFQIVYGGQGFIQRSGKIWAVEVPGDPGRLRGTFVNSDHFSFYLELCLPVVMVVGWWLWRHLSSADSIESRLVAAVVPVLIWVTLLGGVAFSGSRAGLVAAVCAAAAQGVLLALAQRASSKRLRWLVLPSGLLVAFVGLGILAGLGLQQTLGRWLATSAYELTWNDRLRAYGAVLQLWRQFPWLGTGLGTFRESFPLTKPTTLGETWRHAHNDYLELLATGGVVAAVLLLLAMLPLVARLVRNLEHSHRSEDRAVSVAALGALVAVAVHSMFDFGLTMPANAWTLSALVGCATAHLEATKARRRQRSQGSSRGASTRLDVTGEDTGSGDP